MTNRLIAIIFAAISTSIISCRTMPEHWTEARARSVAFDVLRRHHLDPREFREPTVQYRGAQRYWSIYFGSPYPDGEVWVRIDERTGAIFARHGFSPLEGTP